ncbi:MAG TPA: TAT-variant-translocated molybdopterin oxidoreductase [Myxococcota bacterium]|nr:TAT-variant-translocated molybdopterin oxidoreductase [Myxococcota bacterium]
MKQDLEKSLVNGEKLTYWRSIENRRRTKDYIASLHDEFAPDMTDITAMDRRSMLKVMGASIALSGIGISCRRPEERILPYVKEPQGYKPGLAKFFATAQPTPFGAQGILVESHDGRPTKIEGNPEHPESKGKSSTINQAAALEIYDPDRSRFCSEKKPGGHVPVDWAEWEAFSGKHFHELRKRAGAGLAVLLNSDLSPTLLSLKAEIKKAMPQARFFVHEPMREKNIEAGATMAFGPHTRVRYFWENAQVIASLFADPFSCGPEHLAHMRGFAKHRTVHSVEDAKKMNRLYAVEADYSLAGASADHRVRLPIGLAKNFVEALAYELHATHGLDIDAKIPGAQSLTALVAKPPAFKYIDRDFVTALAKDLAKNRGQAVIVGGDHLPPATLAMIHVLNIALLGHKKTFDVVSIDDDQARAHLSEPDIGALAKALSNQEIETLLIIGTNPAYDAPRHLDLKTLIPKVKHSIHLGQRRDETGELCTWHVPETHFLEHFADSRAYDGTISIIQPLIKPLHNARSALEVLALLAGRTEVKNLNLVEETFKNRFGGMDVKKRFDKALHDGVVERSSFPAASLRLNAPAIYESFNNLKSRGPNKDNFELVLAFDRRMLDGRYANNGWLQELADPINKLNWGNALFMSPTAARAYGIKSGVKKNTYVADVGKISIGNKSLELPVFVVPGLADFSLIATLGFGRTAAGEVGDNVGVDVYPLVEDFSNLVHHGVKFERTAKTERLSSTQEQFAMNGDVVQTVDVLTLQNRDPSRHTTVAKFQKAPTAAQNQGLAPSLLTKEPGKKEKVPLQITDAWDYSQGNQWGMVIDLAKCTGCNACVVACQSENNIPVVGKEQVIRGRQMQWIRVDRYFEGPVNAPLALSQPVLCQHCENAPCEPVCPVAATSHDKEGLNVMTYNRCVGTRYCANNCPYKVRRFNYFDFSDSGNLYVPEEKLARVKTLQLQRNPDVTVRYRGVMEKCTYCTQRIQEAKMEARRQGQDQNNLPDGAVTTACAQSCPAEAIVFGNINDSKARVAELKKIDRNYTLLDVLNTRPRTSYLSKLRNPNPELVG